MLFRWCLIVLLTVLCAAIVAAASGEAEPNDTSTNNDLEKYLYLNDPSSALPVVEYTDASKANFLATDKLRVVKFYSPYCVSFVPHKYSYTYSFFPLMTIAQHLPLSIMIFHGHFLSTIQTLTFYVVHLSILLSFLRYHNHYKNQQSASPLI